MNKGQIKKFLYINRRPPHGTNYAQEGLEVAFIGAAFEQDIALVYMDDGVFQLRRNQDTSAIGSKNFSRSLGALGDYEISQIYVEKESLEDRGMSLEDLIPLTYEDERQSRQEISSLHLVSSQKLALLIKQADVIFNF